MHRAQTCMESYNNLLPHNMKDELLCEAERAPLCTKNIRLCKQHHLANRDTKQGKGYWGVVKQLGDGNIELLKIAFCLFLQAHCLHVDMALIQLMSILEWYKSNGIMFCVCIDTRQTALCQWASYERGKYTHVHCCMYTKCTHTHIQRKCIQVRGYKMSWWVRINCLLNPHNEKDRK